MVNLSVTAFLLFFCLLSSYVNCPDPGEIDRVADLVVKMVCENEDTLIKSVITCLQPPGRRSQAHYRGRSKSRSSEKLNLSSRKRSRSSSRERLKSPSRKRSRRGSSKERKPVTRQTLSIVKRVGDQPYDIRFGVNGLILFAEVNPLRAPIHEGKRLVEIVQVDKDETPIVNTIEVAIKYQSGNYTEKEREKSTLDEMQNAMILAYYGFGPAVILARRTESLEPLLPETFLMVKRVKGVTLHELFDYILQAAYTGPLPVTPDLVTPALSTRSFIAALQILELQRVVLEKVKEFISMTGERHCDLTWGNIMIEQPAETQDLPVTTATDLDSVLRWKSKNIIFRSSENRYVPIILDQANIKFIDPAFLEHVAEDSSYPCVHQIVGQRSDVWTVGMWTETDYVERRRVLPHGKVLVLINKWFPRNPPNVSAHEEKAIVDILIGKVATAKELYISVFLDHFQQGIVAAP